MADVTSAHEIHLNLKLLKCLVLVLFLHKNGTLRPKYIMLSHQGMALYIKKKQEYSLVGGNVSLGLGMEFSKFQIKPNVSSFCCL